MSKKSKTVINAKTVKSVNMDYHINPT